ncbi:hypothetical protein [Gallibacterium anatis]
MKRLTPFVPYISALKDGVLRHESDKADEAVAKASAKIDEILK